MVIICGAPPPCKAWLSEMHTQTLWCSYQSDPGETCTEPPPPLFHIVVLGVREIIGPMYREYLFLDTTLKVIYGSNSIAVQWSVFPNPQTDYERFLNIEHPEVYAVYSTTTTKVRNGIVQECCASCKRLRELSQMLSDRRNPASIDSLRESVKVALLVVQQEHTKKTMTGVDRKMQQVLAKKVTRLCIIIESHCTRDTHWAAECTQMLTQLESLFCTHST